MNLIIRTRNFAATVAIRDFVQHRLQGTIESEHMPIQSASVTLSDLNGPKGGIDKRCAIRLSLRGTPTLVVEDTSSDLYQAIDRALARCKRSLLRRVDRMNNRGRTGIAIKHLGVMQ